MTTFGPDEIKAALRCDLASFIRRSFRELNPQTGYLPGRHIPLIADYFQRVECGEIKRLIVTMPPRSLKSHCASIAFPAWCLGRNPSLNIICVSYGQDLAEKFGRDCRSVLQSSWYEETFATRLGARQAVHDFHTTLKGSRRATSVGGPLTGYGGDLIIIDDPIKPEDALSETLRVAANQWFGNTLLSRLNNKETGAIVIVMQRLHQDDLAGHVMEAGGWTVLNLPAIAEEDEHFEIRSAFPVRPYVRKRGEALHPERESLKTLLELKRTMGDFTFQSQYQQKPMPVDGNLIKVEWLCYYEGLPHRFDRVVQSWDTANKAGELNDYSVCTTWGVHDRRFYLLEVVRQRLNFPDLERRVIAEASKYPGCVILIEDKASGTQLIQTLNDKFIYDVVPYRAPAGMDKTMRLHAQSIHFENGRVLLPKEAPWLKDYVGELLGFPGMRYDDQVDSTTQALDYLREPDELELHMRAWG